MILGADLSTRCCGFAILDENGDVIENGYWKLHKQKGLFEKAAEVRKKLNALDWKYDGFTHVFIEEPLMMFMPGKSSAKTLLILAQFNAIIAWECHQLFGDCVTLIHSGTARKLCGIKIVKGRKAKEIVLENISKLYPGFIFEKTRTGSSRQENFDKADAIVVAKAGYIQLTQKGEK